MRGSRRSLRRQQLAGKGFRRTIFVACEGRTELDYLAGLKPLCRSKATLRLGYADGRSNPLQVVKLAVAKRSSEPDWDECWAVFDVDLHEGDPEATEAHLDSVRRAVELARAERICVAASAPCFELWLLLHWQDQQAAVDTRAARELLGRHDPGVARTKRVDMKLYPIKRIRAAAQRAEEMDTVGARGCGAELEHNPSSGMPALLRALGLLE